MRAVIAVVPLPQQQLLIQSHDEVDAGQAEDGWETEGQERASAAGAPVEHGRNDRRDGERRVHRVGDRGEEMVDRGQGVNRLTRRRGGRGGERRSFVAVRSRDLV